MAKGNFLLNDEWGTLFDSLPDELAGQLIKAAFDYHAGKDVQIGDKVLAAVFAMIKSGIDENDKRYAQRCENNKKIAEKRWAKDTDNANVCERMRTDTNHADNDNDIDNDIDSDSDLKNTRIRAHAHAREKPPSKTKTWRQRSTERVIDCDGLERALVGGVS